MTSKLLRFSLAAAVFCATSALAQTGGAASTSDPAAPSASTPTAASITGTKVGSINIEGAIFGTNEGRRDFEALNKKLEPKQNELKSQNDELDGLKKQLNTQGPSLSEDALNNLKKQIESKQKVFDRSVQDAQEDFANQQNEIAQKVLAKMAPMIVKYAQDNGYGMILDTTKQWPQSPVLMAGGALDITKPIIEAYNAQSGVAAPAPTSGAAKPAGPRPAGSTAPKPSTTPK